MLRSLSALFFSLLFSSHSSTSLPLSPLPTGPLLPPAPCGYELTSLFFLSHPHREEAAHKKQEAARKKAEKDALLAAEESTTPSRAAPKNSKTAVKKSRHGLDLSQLDDSSSTSHSPSTNLAALNATGIDNALDALSLTTNDNNATGIGKVDRHPERRFKAAYAAYETRRLAEMEQEQEQKGLRRQQRIEAIRKEFEKSAENPFNQVNARFDSTKEEIREIREKERAKIEARLVEK